MKKVIAGLAVVLIAGIGYLWAQDSSLRKAFLHHHGQESPEVKKYYPQVGGESFVVSEQWKNYQKYAKLCPQIAEVTKKR